MRQLPGMFMLMNVYDLFKVSEANIAQASKCLMPTKSELLSKIYSKASSIWLKKKQKKKKQNKNKQKQTKTKTKQNKTKQNKTKQNKTKQKPKQNKTKQNKTKQNTYNWKSKAGIIQSFLDEHDYSICNVWIWCMVHFFQKQGIIRK